MNSTPHWIHELNLDPDYRVPAGFGTRVVQDQDETYMDAAWGQIGQVLEANRDLVRQALGLASLASAAERSRLFHLFGELREPPQRREGSDSTPSKEEPAHGPQIPHCRIDQ